ncbi:MAG TPA: twin-arginine translocase TatA/TatE family subunit [Solirubrobacteraceae bacterium]|jgi:sec-independent protein translocase protein TatA
MGLDNPIHLAFLLVILLLVFGAKRLPEMGRSLGHGLRGFKESINGEATPGAELSPATAVDHPVGGEVATEQATIHPATPIHPAA